MREPPVVRSPRYAMSATAAAHDSSKVRLKPHGSRPAVLLVCGESRTRIPTRLRVERRRARAKFEFVRAAFSASDPNAATDVRAEDGPVGAASLFVTEGLAFGATTVPGASRGLPALPGAKARRFVDADFISNVSTMAVDFVQDWLAEAGLTRDLKAVGQLQISLQAALLTPDGPRFAYVSDGPTAQLLGRRR